LAGLDNEVVDHDGDGCRWDQMMGVDTGVGSKDAPRRPCRTLTEKAICQALKKTNSDHRVVHWGPQNKKSPAVGGACWE
jgi:hypothetical protein